MLIYNYSFTFQRKNLFTLSLCQKVKMEYDFDNLEQLSRDECFYLAELAIQIQHYDTAFYCIKQAVRKSPHLSPGQRSNFRKSFKQWSVDRRCAWDNVIEYQNKQKENEEIKPYIQKKKNEITKELYLMYNTMLDLIDQLIQKDAQTIESKIFYWRMKADVFRYRTQISKGKELQKAQTQALELYEKILSNSEALLEKFSLDKITTQLNFSILLEQNNQKERAKLIINEAIMNLAENQSKISLDQQENFEKLRQLVVDFRNRFLF